MKGNHDMMQLEKQQKRKATTAKRNDKAVILFIKVVNVGTQSHIKILKHFGYCMTRYVTLLCI